MEWPGTETYEKCTRVIIIIFLRLKSSEAGDGQTCSSSRDAGCSGHICNNIRQHARGTARETGSAHESAEEGSRVLPQKMTTERLTKSVIMDPTDILAW
jgi:hypothetical protein